MTTKKRNAFITHVNCQSHQKDSNRFAIIAALYGAKNWDGDLALRRANQISQEFFNSECRAEDKSTLFKIVNGVMEHYGTDSGDQIESFIESAKSLIGFRTDAQSKLLILEKLAQLNPMRQHAANRFIAWHMGVKERVELLEALKEIPDSTLREVFWFGNNLIKSWMNASMRVSILKSLADLPDEQRADYAAKVRAQISFYSNIGTFNKLSAQFSPKLAPPPLTKEMAQEEQLLDFIHSRVASSTPAQHKLYVDPNQLFDANGKPAQPHRLLLEYFWKARHIGAHPVKIDSGEPNFLGKLFTSLCHKEQRMLPMRSADDASIGRIPVLDNSAPGALPQAKQIECLRAIGTVFGNAMGGSSSLLKGHYFHPILYQMIHSLDKTDVESLVDTEDLQPDKIKAHKKLFTKFLQEMHGKQLGSVSTKEVEDLLLTPPTISPTLMGLGLTEAKVAELISKARPTIQATLVIAKAMYAKKPTDTDWQHFKQTSWMALQRKIEEHDIGDALSKIASS